MKRCAGCGNLFAGEGWRCPRCGNEPQQLDGFLSFAPGLSDASSSYDAARYHAVAAVERGHFWFRARNQLIAWGLARFFPKADSLLEIGCGTGQVLASIHAERPELKVVGTEIHTKGLSYCRERLPDAEFIQMDARSVPFADEFDVVCAFDVLEHIVEDDAVLAQMYKSCRPGGGIMITVPQHQWLWSYKDDFAHHQRRYARNELETKVATAGFRVQAVTSFVSLLLPLLYLSRVRECAPEGFDPQRELEISPLLNRIFSFVMLIELLLIRAGFRFPAGGSLLLLAKKSG